jgi:hypothetical protein
MFSIPRDSRPLNIDVVIERELMINLQKLDGKKWMVVFGADFLIASLKNTYRLSEQAASCIFGILSNWRDRCCEIIIQQGNHRRIS